MTRSISAETRKHLLDIRDISAQTRNTFAAATRNIIAETRNISA
jgi:hypothetical protein